MLVEANTLVRLRESAALEASGERTGSAAQLQLDMLIDAMERREATRYYSDEGISSSWLESAARVCFKVDKALFEPDSSASPIELLAFVRRASGCAPGVYWYREAGWEAVELAQEIRISDIVLQPEFAQAAAILLSVGSLDAPNSSHHHRRLLSRAGAAIEACWLSAVERGYDGSIFAGFIPSALRSAGLIDGYRRVQLLALAVGVSTRGKEVEQ